MNHSAVTVLCGLPADRAVAVNQMIQSQNSTSSGYIKKERYKIHIFRAPEDDPNICNPFPTRLTGIQCGNEFLPCID